MEETIKKYEEIIGRVSASIAQAEQFKDDLMGRYDKTDPDLENTLKIQSMVLKIDDYISQKHMTKVDLERQLLDISQVK